MGFFPKILASGGIMAVALALGGCVYDDYGYGGVGLGYGAGGYYDDYGYGYGGPAFGYGLGYGSGWYNDFYYPGTGYYVYDRGGRRSRWNGDQRRYWEGRRQTQQARRDYRGERRDDRQGFRQERRDDRRALRQGEVTRDQFRTDRRADRQEFRQDRRQDRQQFRQGTGRPAPGVRGNDIRPPRANRPAGSGAQRGGLVGRVQNRVQRR